MQKKGNLDSVFHPSAEGKLKNHHPGVSNKARLLIQMGRGGV